MPEQDSEHLILRRIVDAGATVVFAAFVDPATLQRWWCPEGYLPSNVEVDARVGGRYRLTMKPIEGSGPEIHISGEYRDLEEPHRIVMTHAFPPGSGEQFDQLGLIGHETLVTIRLTEVDGRTELLLIQEDIPPGASKMLRFGWTSILESLSRQISQNETGQASGA